MLKYSEDNMKHVRDIDTAQLVFHEIYSGNMFRDTCGMPSRCSADATHIVCHSFSIEEGNARDVSRGSR